MVLAGVALVAFCIMPKTASEKYPSTAYLNDWFTRMNKRGGRYGHARFYKMIAINFYNG